MNASKKSATYIRFNLLDKQGNPIYSSSQKSNALLKRRNRMPRIPLHPVKNPTPEQQSVYDSTIGLVGLLGATKQLTLHCPELADKWLQLGELLKNRNSLQPRLSELAILVTARHWDCQYEWYAHEPAAIKGGLPAAVIDSIRAGQRPAFDDPDEEAIYDYCRELHETHFVSDQVYKRVLDQLGPSGVVELTALLGYFVMVSMSLNAHEYGLPAGIKPPLPTCT
jgi:4-carboxymuconolactone decarboxylase